MHSMLHSYVANLSADDRSRDAVDSMSSTCVIKAEQAASREMRVQMTAKQGFLTISFCQESGGTLHAFELCKLTLHNLVVFCPRGSCCFAIAAQMSGKLHHEIYCYPGPDQMHTWLQFFKRKSVYLGMINLSDIPEDAELCEFL